MSITTLSLWLSLRATAAPELCNGIDDDGDYNTDEGPVAGYSDIDGDGLGDRTTVVWSVDCASQPAVLVDRATDCDDNDPAISPDSGELADVNGIDEDCDGEIDEDVAPSDNDCEMLYDDNSAFLACAESRDWDQASDLCSGRGYHLATIDDADENYLLYSPLSVDYWWIGYYEETANTWVWESSSSSYENFATGQPNTAGLTCALVYTWDGDWYDDNCISNYPYICEADCVAYDTFADADTDGLGDPGSVLPSCTLPAGRVWNSADCDDTSSAITTRIWFEDLDHDDYGSDVVLGTGCDTLPNSSDTSGDCDDDNDAVNPNLTERCDTDFDDDCDGLINDDDDQIDITTASPYYYDGDVDGYGAGELRVSCVAPDGFVDNDSDCDDNDTDIHPEASERCNEADDDCDGDIDEDILTTWYADRDGDGAGDRDAPIDDCDPQDAADNDSDCDDTDDTIYPGAADLPDDGIDQDCDGTDAGEPLTSDPQAEEDRDGDGYPAEEDCDDDDPAAHPGATEDLGPSDLDCDGLSDPTDKFHPACSTAPPSAMALLSLLLLAASLRREAARVGSG